MRHRHVDASPGQRDAGPHERERAAERHGERAVGARPVADHHSCVAGDAAEQVDRRPPPSARAACRRSTGATPAAVLHRGEDRPTAGDRPVGRRVRRVVVRADQAGAVARRGGRDAHPLVVELAVEADDHDVDVYAGGIVAGHGHRADAPRPPRRPRVRRTTSTRSPGSTSAAAAIADVSTSPSAGMPIGGQRGLLVGEARRRVVGDEHDPAPAAAQRGPRPRPIRGSAECASQITPSRSSSTARGVHGLAHGTGRLRRLVACQQCRRCPASNRSAPPLRARSVDLDAVIAPPYDVLSDADVDALAARDAHNIVHVDVPRGGDRPLRRSPAGCCGSGWPTACWSRDEQPTFTLYRMRFTDDAGAAPRPRRRARRPRGRRRGRRRRAPPRADDAEGVDRPARPHPGDDGQPVADLGPVAGRRPHRPAARARASRSGRSTVDGVEHVVERVDRPGANRRHPRAPSAGDDVLIADGHHRYGISRTYRDEVRAATGRHDTPAEQTLAFVGELVAEQLSIAATSSPTNASVCSAGVSRATGGGADLVAVRCG